MSKVDTKVNIHSVVFLSKVLLFSFLYVRWFGILSWTLGTLYCEYSELFYNYFINHSNGVYPANTNGTPFTAAYIAVSGDPIADLNEDLAAEQKARVTYDNILRLVDDPDVRDPIKFLRQREITHYQRFGDALRIAQDHADCKNFYAYNPAFDWT